MKKDRTPPTIPMMHSVADVVALTGLAPSTIRRAISTKVLRVHRFGRAVRVSDADLTEYLARHRQ